MDRSARLFGALALLATSIACSGSDIVPPPQLSEDATLSSLNVSAGILSPAFSLATTRYTLAVPFGTTSVTVTPTATDPKALSVGVRQDNLALYAVDGRHPGVAVAVPAVSTTSTVTVRVTAESGGFGNYTIALTQSAKLHSDASLKSLSVSAGTLVPAFDPTIFSYAMQVPNGTTSLTLAPASNDASVQSIRVKQDGGAFGTSMTLSVPAVGATSNVTIEITAQDGTVADYQISFSQQAPVAPTNFTIYSIGDSTMADYDPAQFPNQAGWGQELRTFVVGNVGYVNAAKNGRSSKSFYNDGSWAAVSSNLHAGDFVLIQFAHNDESDNGLEGPDGISTAPFGAYQVFLGKYVDETRAAGATPILVTPIVRRNFDATGTTITPKGAHDLTGVGDPSIPPTQDLNYVEAMKQVATNKSVPVIDMTASTKQLVEQFGPTDAKSVIYIAADDTHIQPLGATMFAELAVQAMLAQNLFTGFLNPAGGVYVSPASLSYGTVFTNQTSNKTVSITGLTLSPDSGNVTVTAPSGFAVAASAAGTFGSSIQLPYTGGRLVPTDIVVRFAPANATTYSGSVSIAPPTGAAQSIAVSGTGTLPTTGGTDSSVVYALNVDDSCATTGLATCANQAFSNLYARDHQPTLPADGSWNPAAPADTTIQRISILNTTTPDQWPGNESAPVPDRWAQYAVSPASGKSWTIDTISTWVGTMGGSNMGYQLEYSVNDTTFANATTLTSGGFVKDVMTMQSFPMTLTLAPGDTLYIRAYPWLKGSQPATGKYLVLKTLTIHGNAQ
jgi:lysophospholipase L1-like esterase